MALPTGIDREVSRKSRPRTKNPYQERIDQEMIHKKIGRLAGSVASAIIPGAGIAGAIGGAALSSLMPRAAPVVGEYFRTGSGVEITGGAPDANGCPPGFVVARDKCTGEIYCKKSRKRRKKMLTCGDKSDIAFIIGQLGKGASGQSAISALLSRCL